MPSEPSASAAPPADDSLAGKSGAAEMSEPFTSPAEDTRIARLLQEAACGHRAPAGTKPAGREAEEDDIFRSMLARVLEMNRSVAARHARWERGALAGLYSADSFSSPEKMGCAAGAVRRLFAENREIAREMEVILAEVKTQVDSGPWTEAEKREFWTEIAEGFAAKFRGRARFVEKLRHWSEATADLYEFALVHFGKLSFDGKTVRTPSRQIGEQFAQKLATARKSRDEYRRVTAQLETEQADVWKR